MSEDNSDLRILMKSMTQLFVTEHIMDVRESLGQRGCATDQAAVFAELSSAIPSVALQARAKKFARAAPGAFSRDRPMPQTLLTPGSGDDPDDQSSEDDTDEEDSAGTSGQGRGEPLGVDGNKSKVGGKVLGIAVDYVKDHEYKLASIVFMHVAQYALGYDHRYPEGNSDTHGVESPGYRALGDNCRNLVMGCSMGLSDCMLMSNQGRGFCNILPWLYEIELIMKNRRYLDTGTPSLHDWLYSVGLTIPVNLTLNLVECLFRKAGTLQEIGNSSAYQQNLTAAARFLFALDAVGSSADLVRVNALNDRMKSHDEGILSRRHPDPDSNGRYLIVDPDLQVRGAWKKITIPLVIENVDPAKRNYSSFIWRGHIYVARGKLPGPFTKPDPPELWRLDLKKRDQWEFVTIFPCIKGEGVYNPPCVDGNKMYAFMGHPRLDVLDLVTKTWSTLKTTWKPTVADQRAGIDPFWPWPRKSCADAAQAVVDGHFFVFGGINGMTLTGCNLFMQLDLRTLRWRRLNGVPWMTEFKDLRLPGPRASCGSWVNKPEKKLYVFSGVVHMARGIEGDKYGPPKPWVYDDLWSWDTKTETWREEKMKGNSPSPRYGAGCVFSQKINKAVVFGGINPTCFTVIGESSDSRLSEVFYADTFMWNPLKAQGAAGPSGEPVPAHWQQIQTVGFPTYRMGCDLLVDPDTQDIYLYGGVVLGDTIPSKNHTEVQRRKRVKHETELAKAIASSPAVAEMAKALGMEALGSQSFTQHFNDLWKLHIDVPGGDFECINMEDEMRTAPLGPWNRCFECRKAGFWKKCGGSCGGKAFFCGVECQKKGWKEHQKLHGCKKIGKSGSGAKA